MNLQKIRNFALLTLSSIQCFPLLAQSVDTFSVNGNSNLQFERQISKEGGGDTHGSFDVDSFDLLFTFRPTQKLRVVSGLSLRHGTEISDSRVLGSFLLDLGYAEYTIREWLKLRFGKFRLPVGYYNEIETTKIAMVSVNAPQVTRAPLLVDSAFSFFPRWGTGLGVVGNFHIVGHSSDYSLLLTNGQAQSNFQDSPTNPSSNPFGVDANISKAVAGRIRVSFLDESLILGPSFYYDPDSDREKDQRTQIRTFGLFTVVNWGAFEAILEGMRGVYNVSFDNDDAKKSAAASYITEESTTQLGWYLQLSYKIPMLPLTPYVRYEQLDPELGRNRDNASIQIYGINWSVNEMFDFKVDIEVFKGSQNSGEPLATLPNRGYQELKASLAVGF